MSRTSRFAISALPWVAATALLCAMTVPGATGAWAQTATNLKCKKCVDEKDLAKKAVTSNRIKNGAVVENRLSTDLQEHFNEREGFYITLDGNGATQTIATNGPLNFFARCLINQPDGLGGSFDRVEIVATSSLGGWFESNESDSNAGNPPLTAGQEVIAATETSNPSGTARFDEPDDQSIMMAPDGSYLAIDDESAGIGLNILGHDCFVAGVVHRITGAL